VTDVKSLFGIRLPKHEKSQVLVLGSPHLVQDLEPKEFRPEAFEPLLKTLERFCPDLIAVETIPASHLEWMLINDPQGQRLANLGYPPRIVVGKQMQNLLQLTRAQAEQKAETLLRTLSEATPPKKRLELIAHLIASYQFDTAVLHWAYLPETSRKDTSVLPQEAQEFLERRRQSIGEHVRIALELAYRLKHQRLYPIDSHLEAEFLPAHEEEWIKRFLEGWNHDPEFQSLAKSMDAWNQRLRERLRESVRQGNVLPLYLYYNSKAYAKKDLEQWRVFYRTQFAEGVDRGRVAFWEARNLLMAANIMSLLGYYPRRRLLVVVGASHKPYLDTYLQMMVSVQVVQLSRLV